ncbi:MAG: hypothetical protein ACRDQ4_03135 [Pseudonocardiaceae bacterium]
MATRPPRPDAALSARTVVWLAEHPHQREVVRSVWDELAELERAGYHRRAIDALRSVLLDHQPATRPSRCRTCRRVTWRRRLRGDSARTRGTTDAGTLVEHLMTDEAAADGRGRRVAVRGARVLPASKRDTIPPPIREEVNHG